MILNELKMCVYVLYKGEINTILCINEPKVIEFLGITLQNITFLNNRIEVFFIHQTAIHIFNKN